MNKTSAAIFCLEVVLLKSHVLLPLSKNSAILTPLLTQCTTTLNLLISSDLPFAPAAFITLPNAF